MTLSLALAWKRRPSAIVESARAKAITPAFTAMFLPPRSISSSPCSQVSSGTMARKAQRAYNAKRANKVEPPQPVLWSPPPIDECDVKTMLTEPDLTNRITVKQVLWSGQLVSYAVIHHTLVGPGRWEEVMCIDCCHQTVHRHSGPHGSKKPEVIRSIYTQQDVQSSFDSSFDEIYDGYEEHKGRS